MLNKNGTKPEYQQDISVRCSVYIEQEKENMETTDQVTYARPEGWTHTDVSSFPAFLPLYLSI